MKYPLKTAMLALVLVPVLADLSPAADPPKPAAPAKPLVKNGDVAPPIPGKEFINIEPITLEDLRGRVVIVEFFRTTSKPSAEQELHLDEMQDKSEGKGLTILAVTNEPRKLVDEYVAANKVRHAVVIETGDSAATYGIVKGYPSIFVVGPDGKIAWFGNWIEEADMSIFKIMKAAKQSPRLPARLSGIGDSIAAGRLAEARKLLDAEFKAGKVTALEQPSVQRAVVWLDKQFAAQIAAADATLAEGKLYEAAIEYERIAKDCAETDAGAQAAEKVKQLLSDATKKREIDAGRALAAAVEAAKAAPGKKAIPLYKAVISKWKDTAAAKKAAEMIAEIEKPAEPAKPK